ncbi:hypothetical protein QTP88_024414 [Uroleucon formosanum]
MTCSLDYPLPESVKIGLKASMPRQEFVTDMVVMLLETPFRRWHSDNKNDLLKVGKPIPILSALAPDKKLSKDRLTNMAIISIERELASKINFEDIIDEFATKKARKVKF